MNRQNHRGAGTIADANEARGAGPRPSALVATEPEPALWDARPARQDEAVLDHVSIQCADVTASARFYDAVLPALGGARVMDFGEVIGYGVHLKPDFWIGPQATGAGFRESHIAFAAPDRAAVRAFFDAAVSAGLDVLHEPRLWPEYHPTYYAAFVRDPDGNNVEAVCQKPG
jgi:catechol 2,3-dioxygenase-like lactoylglutathione lyase family enzyme